MQGIPLLILTFVVLYLGRKLLFFLKALQAIQYVINNNLMVLLTSNTISPGTTQEDVFCYHHPI